MCVLSFAWKAHPRWTLVAIANRDEFHGRAAAPLAMWNDGSGIVAGRDLAGGGTWLGVSPTRFVALTNLRSDEAPDPHKRSRGALVTDLLTGATRPDAADVGAYNPFSLVAIDASTAWLLTSHGDCARTELAEGVHGLTNGPYSRPWPKLAALTTALTDWLQAGDQDAGPLWAALRDESVPHGAFDEATALPAFIRNPVYGTRCSTLVLVDAEARGTIIERRFDSAGLPTGESRKSFAWAAAHEPHPSSSGAPH
jgi:uncharacterized protein with NRDE domain